LILSYVSEADVIPTSELYHTLSTMSIGGYDGYSRLGIIEAIFSMNPTVKRLESKLASYQPSH